MNRHIEISFRTILLAAGLVAALWFVGQVLDILLLLFISFLLMTALHPLVSALEKLRLPRIIAIILIYALVFGFIGATVATSVPALVVQSTHLFETLPEVIARVAPHWNIDVNTVSQQLAPVSENIVKVTLGIFSNIVTTMTVLVFTFYFLLERKHADGILREIVGERVAGRVFNILRVIERRLGAWVRGQLVLMVSVGVFTYIGLTILHVDFALPLAIFAGLLELVPTIGPIISAVPSVIVALATSPVLGLSVAALYFVIQQLENGIFVPLIMKKSVGFSPIVSILCLMIGARFAGVVGAILGIPFALVLQVVVTTILSGEWQEPKEVAKNP